jgi:hypothetical protein
MGAALGSSWGGCPRPRAARRAFVEALAFWVAPAAAWGCGTGAGAGAGGGGAASAASKLAVSAGALNAGFAGCAGIAADGLSSLVLKSASMFAGKVFPVDQMSSSFESFSFGLSVALRKCRWHTFWFSGMTGIISFIKAGRLSVIFRSPLAWAAPAATHCLVMESMMYSTPSL